eukprot:scaffold9957_cov88-Skeletonema_marinoi.AAC.1
MLPCKGQPTSDEEKLRATWNANCGAGPVAWTDLYDLLESFWKTSWRIRNPRGREMMTMMMMTAATKTAGIGMASVSILANAMVDVAMVKERMESAMIVPTVEERVITSTHCAHFMMAAIIHTRIASSVLLVITSRRTRQRSTTNLAMLLHAVEYFHLLLNHPGSKSLSHALSKFYHPQLAARISAFNCDICQRTKISQHGGHFPPRSVEDLYPWKQCNVDLIGPSWYVSTSGRSGKSYQFYALTAIVRATGFPDGIKVKMMIKSGSQDTQDLKYALMIKEANLLALSSNNNFMMQGLHQLLLQHEIHKATQL